VLVGWGGGGGFGGGGGGGGGVCGGGGWWGWVLGGGGGGGKVDHVDHAKKGSIGALTRKGLEETQGKAYLPGGNGGAMIPAGDVES